MFSNFWLVGGRVSVGGWVEVDDWKTQFQLKFRSQTWTLTDGCRIGKQSNSETRVVTNYLQFRSSKARVSSSENEKIAISQQLSQIDEKNNGTSKLKGIGALNFLFWGKMAEIWSFSHSYKIITIDDFNSVEIDENGGDEDSNHYFYIIDDKSCQKKI